MLRASHAASDGRQRSSGMAATLFTELEGRVPQGLIADIVRTVLDDSRRAAQDLADDFTMQEARKRLERFIRARSYS